MKILVIHGPNLDLLGVREPEVYGRETLADIDGRLRARAGESGVSVETFQSNHEGALVDRLHAARGEVDAIVINPGGLTHTSVVLRDALLALGVPFIEVHLSNVYARESFRRESRLADVALGQITGLGAIGYELALHALVERLK